MIRTTQNSGPATILIVEDDPGVALLEKRCLERFGYRVRTAATISQALEAVRAEPVELMLLDNGLADGETGLSLFAAAKAAGYRMPAIVVTGSTEGSLVLEALREGVSDFVAKTPDYLTDLAQSVRRVLEQTEMQRRLEASEARFHSFMNHCPAVAFVMDQSGQLVYANRTFEQVFQCFEWQGNRPSELGPAEAILGAIGLNASESNGNGEFLVRVPSREGIPRDWTAFQFPMRDAQGEPLTGTFMLDVTERLEAQEQLRQREDELKQSQRFEALGNLASGVAHDFNNMLQVIDGFARLALARLDTAGEPYLHLEQLLEVSEGAQTLTRQLLGFGRERATEREVIGVNQIVEDLLGMLHPLVRSLEVDAQFTSEPAPVLADRGQLQQVLLNLCLNSRDAMRGSGRLTLRTERLDLDSDIALPLELAPGPHAVITVADTGCGMTDDVRRRLFEPFFTTKESGKGIGLGLTVAHRIVREHHGALRVDSALGQGTSFGIMLPLAPAPASDDSLRARHPATNEHAIRVDPAHAV